MAAQTALGTPELLENIVSHLPAYDILASAQRVSLSCKAVTDASPDIRKTLWLQQLADALSPSRYTKPSSIRSIIRASLVHENQ
jgi:hypothetical protein